MKFNFKNYKFLKFKNNLRANSIIYICNTKTKKNFIKTMQYYNGLNFHCHKINNSLVKSCLRNSTYLNYINMFSGLTLLAELNNYEKLNMTSDLKKLREEHIIIGLNINNKVYVINENINKLVRFNFVEDSKSLLHMFKTNLKSLKKFRNNVI